MTGYLLTRPVEILMVEDNPGDVRLTREGLQEGKVHHHLQVVDDGLAALAFLRREAPYADAPRPDLILLDLSLPGKDGREVLAEIKADERLKRIPVVVLSSSSQDEDILRAYHLQVNCYITKPVNLPDFLRVVSAIENFWLEVVKLPPD